jgi:high affinity Mn2+ porin
MGNYQDAMALPTPDVSLVRHESSKGGLALNIEQSLTADIGLFARFSSNDGSKETWDFTDINRSLSAGVSVKGTQWGRELDRVGIAFAINDLSKPARDYFEAGGLGVLIGEGPHNGYGSERIFESFYSVHINNWCNLTADYQYIQNPGYNPNNADVSIVGFRVHLAI